MPGWIDFEKFGPRLERLRIEKKITNNQLAELVGVTPFEIRRWQRFDYDSGDSFHKYEEHLEEIDEHIEKLAEIFETNMNYIRIGHRLDPPEPDPPDLRLV